jgi:hypothetical protein
MHNYNDSVPPQEQQNAIQHADDFTCARALKAVFEHKHGVEQTIHYSSNISTMQCGEQSLCKFEENIM